MITDFKILELTPLKNQVLVRYKFNKNDYKYENTRYFKNPIHLLVYKEEMPVDALAEVLRAFEKVEIEIDVKKGEKYDTEEKLKKAIEKWEKEIDEYAQYIDDYRLWKKTISHNEKCARIIRYIKEHREIPTALTQKGYEELISQAFGILRGLKVRSDRITIIHMINWIKKLGFKKVHSTNDVVYFQFQMPTTSYDWFVTMCYQIKKVNDEYKVRFLYSNDHTETTLDKPIWERDLFNELNSDDTRYYSAQF